MKKYYAAAALQLTFMCFSERVLCGEKGSTISLTSKANKVSYENRVEGGWGTLYFSSSDGTRRPLLQPSNPGSIYFEEGSKSDFSEDKSYLVIHKVERGLVLLSETERYPVEKYYCVFLDMNSGCIVNEKVGEFCGGVWGAKSTEWVVGGEHYIIDIRKDSDISRLDVIEHFKTSGVDNFHACFP